MEKFSCEIKGHEMNQSDKLVYTIVVISSKNNAQRIGRFRYSEIKAIHEELSAIISKMKLHIVLPEFPTRRLFGSTNKSQQSVLERQIELSEYLNRLLAINKLHFLEIMKKTLLPPTSEQMSSDLIHFQASIDRYTLVSDVVIYFVRLRNIKTSEEWVFKTRYSQLWNLHEALVKSQIKNLPMFPKKKIFGITNQSPEEIQKRRSELEKYFNEIFMLVEASNSEVVKFFLDQSRLQAARQKVREKDMLQQKSDI